MILIQKVIYYIVFYLSWAVCVHEASLGNGFIGPALIGVVIAFHLWFVKKTWMEFFFVLIVAVIGTLIDTVYMEFGIMTFAAKYESVPWLAPLWVTSLYALFAAAFVQSFSWLRGRWLLMIACGAIGGPLSYAAAVRVGAGEFLVPLWVACLVLAVVWALIFPLCFLLLDSLD